MSPSSGWPGISSPSPGAGPPSRPRASTSMTWRPWSAADRIGVAWSSERGGHPERRGHLRPAAACVAVLGDQDPRRRLAAGGRRLIEERYSWNSLEDRPKTASRDLSRSGTPRSAAGGQRRRSQNPLPQLSPAPVILLSRSNESGMSLRSGLSRTKVHGKTISRWGPSARSVAASRYCSE